MRTHRLKTDPDVFDAVWNGKKTHEIRFNDRGFAVGDELVLQETRYSGAQMREGSPLEFTGRVTTRCVSHIQSGYGLGDGWCILSFVQAADAGIAGATEAAGPSQAGARAGQMRAALEATRYALRHAPELEALGFNICHAGMLPAEVDESGVSRRQYETVAAKLRQTISDATDAVRTALGTIAFDGWTSVIQGLPVVGDDPDQPFVTVWAINTGMPGYESPPTAGLTRYHKKLGWQPLGSTGWDWIVTHWTALPEHPAP